MRGRRRERKSSERLEGMADEDDDGRAGGSRWSVAEVGAREVDLNLTPLNPVPRLFLGGQQQSAQTMTNKDSGGGLA